MHNSLGYFLGYRHTNYFGKWGTRTKRNFPLFSPTTFGGEYFYHQKQFWTLVDVVIANPTCSNMI
jgi:hypothetical protein